MENPTQISERSSLKHITQQTAIINDPSKIHLARVLLKLLPIAFNFRKDRRKWVKNEGKNIDEEKYRKHAEKALKVFVELGPSYIKLGQWLSTRADILPQPYLEILAKLQDEVPPASFLEVKSIIESELGKINEVFETFDTSVLSGASLGQVYHARYNGKDVIVKVSRPNIERIVENDIYFLKKILPIATRFIDPNLRFSAEGMLSQFIETIHEEMDYRTEAKNLITIKNNLKSDKMIIIPNVILERTSKHVLTLEYIPGVKITDIEQLENMEIDREKLVVRIHHVFFKMLLRHSIFHADPHPGNISVAENGAIILYDFGMIGRIDNQTRIILVRLYLALVEKDAARTVNALMELKTLEPTVNRYVVEKALEMSIQSLHGQKVDRMEVNALMELANKTMTRFPFRLPKNLALYMRMTSILEGIYHHHKVKFQFVKVLSNLLEQEELIKEAYSNEIKESIKRFTKGIEASFYVAPLIKSYLETHQQQYYYNNNFKTTHNLIAASIFASSLFLGSVIMLPYNPYLSYGGFIASVATFVTTTLWKKSSFR